MNAPDIQSPAKTEMVSLSSIVLTVDHPTVQKWIGRGATVIASKWSGAGGSLKVFSKRSGEYQIIRAFFISLMMVPADSIPEPQVSVDIRTTDLEELAEYQITGHRREEA